MVILRQLQLQCGLRSAMRTGSVTFAGVRND